MRRGGPLLPRPGSHFARWARSLKFGSGVDEFGLQVRAIRATYYTSVQGDDERLQDVRQRLWSLGFHPEVFKKAKGERAKGVDITLSRDMLAHAYQDNYDAAVLVTGDGDYIPLVEDVKRQGKNVYCAFFADTGYGLNPDLRLAADGYASCGDLVRESWTKPTTD